MDKSTINGHFQWLYSITRGYFPIISSQTIGGCHLSLACGALRSSISGAATAAAMALQLRMGRGFVSVISLAPKWHCGEKLQTIPPKNAKNHRVRRVSIQWWLNGLSKSMGRFLIKRTLAIFLIQEVYDSETTNAKLQMLLCL